MKIKKGKKPNGNGWYYKSKKGLISLIINEKGYYEIYSWEKLFKDVQIFEKKRQAKKQIKKHLT